MIINCLAVDDEPLALGLISNYINQTGFLNLVKACSDSVEALNELHSGTKIDVIFLDIQMPGLTGMELARALSKDTSNPIPVVFTTAYNQFAIEGYDVNALGYLLKPFGYDQFLQTAIRVKNYFERTDEKGKADTPALKDQFLYVKADYKLVRIDIEKILYIESLKDYVKIHLTPPEMPIMSLSTLKGIEEKLPASRFVRIHRSFLVAVDKIDSISKSAVHVGKTEIVVGDQYKDAFKTLLSQWGNF